MTLPSQFPTSAMWPSPLRRWSAWQKVFQNQKQGRFLTRGENSFTPGLIDLHVHVYDGVVPYGIPPDPNCIAKGATTVVDAGSAGAHTFPGFRRYVINIASTRVYALLNISVIGQASSSLTNQWGELLDLRYANPKLAVRTIEKNRDVIKGIKVRLGRNLSGGKTTWKP